MIGISTHKTCKPVCAHNVEVTAESTSRNTYDKTINFYFGMVLTSLQYEYLLFSSKILFLVIIIHVLKGGMYLQKQLYLYINSRVTYTNLIN
jgi:hypothetical protein